jgi:hypothetical protein
MEKINYTTYDNNASGALKDNNKQNNSNAALANRPLMPIKQECGCNKNKKNNPMASEDLHKSGNLPVNTTYSEKNNLLLPTVIVPGKNNNYDVLEHELNSGYDVMEFKPTNNLIVKHVEREQKESMNFATHFFMGSLTVIGLFVFYRLIQKTR